MKRKLVFLPSVHSKEVVDDINLFFNKGYEIEDILNADDGYYIILVLKGEEKYFYKFDKNIDLPGVNSGNYNLIEEKQNIKQDCVNSNKKEDVIFN